MIRQRLRLCGSSMATISFRIDLADGKRLGPGKYQLLQLIDDLGSISAAGRAMKMSYRRAWLLIGEINASFGTPLVEKTSGGVGGGGASLTSVGQRVLKCLDEIDLAVNQAVTKTLSELDELSHGGIAAKKKAGTKSTGRRS